MGRLRLEERVKVRTADISSMPRPRNCIALSGNCASCPRLSQGGWRPPGGRLEPQLWVSRKWEEIGMERTRTKGVDPD